MYYNLILDRLPNITPNGLKIRTDFRESIKFELLMQNSNIEEKDNAKEDQIERLVVGAIITNKNAEILLIKRKADDFLGGIFEIPGGKVENKESILNALIREVKEETNLDVKNINSYIDKFEYLSGSGKKCRQFNFYVETNADEKKIKLTEHDTYKWVGLDKIEAQNISDEVKECLIIYRFNEE